MESHKPINFKGQKFPGYSNEQKQDDIESMMLDAMFDNIGYSRYDDKIKYAHDIHIVPTKDIAESVAKDSAEIRKINAEIHKITKSGALNFGNFLDSSLCAAAQGELDELEYLFIANSHVNFVIFPGTDLSASTVAGVPSTRCEHAARKLRVVSAADFAVHLEGKLYSAIFTSSFGQFGEHINVKYVTKWSFFEKVIADPELGKFLANVTCTDRK